MRLIRNIGSVLRLPKFFQQRCADSTLRDTKLQLVSIDPERSCHRFGKALFFTLDEPVIARVAAGSFETEPRWAKLLQLFPEFSNGRSAPLLRLTEEGHRGIRPYNRSGYINPLLGTCGNCECGNLSA